MTFKPAIFPSAARTLLALMLIAATLPLSAAQRNPPAARDEAPDAAEIADGRETITPSGLQPDFPAQARCPQIASAYASPTRYDGSARPRWAFGGLHGGIDITLAEGTPLLALAAGTVIGKGEGGMLEGIFLWLRHAPEDTGLPYWVYSKYQQLESLPTLENGARVAVGQLVARAGKTGTVGRHYGMSGYPHLHLTTRKSNRGDLAAGPRGAERGLFLFDPLAIYREAAGEPPANSRAVPIPYASTDGNLNPAGTRVVWPVACPPKS